MNSSIVFLCIFLVWSYMLIPRKEVILGCQLLSMQWLHCSVGFQIPPTVLLHSSWQLEKRTRESHGESEEARPEVTHYWGDTYHFCPRNSEDSSYTGPPNCEGSVCPRKMMQNLVRIRRSQSQRAVVHKYLWYMHNSWLLGGSVS